MKRLLRWAIVAFALNVSGAAMAGSFQVNPIRIDLRAGATTGTMTLRNDGDAQVVVQTSVLAWTQDNGKDIYAETAGALVAPPIATIPPGGEQILRVGLRGAPDPARELSYRVFVQEIPPPPQPGFTGLRVALRLGIPVFVAPLAAPTRAIDWSAQQLPDGMLRLVLSNRGNTHLQITDFALFAGDAPAPVASDVQLAYALAGQSREWTLRVSPDRIAAQSSLRVRAQTDAGEIEATVPLRR